MGKNTRNQSIINLAGNVTFFPLQYLQVEFSVSRNSDVSTVDGKALWEFPNPSGLRYWEVNRRERERERGRERETEMERERETERERERERGREDILPRTLEQKSSWI